jgi:hypothetical protein
MPIALLRRAISVPIGFLKTGFQKGPERRRQIQNDLLPKLREGLKTAAPAQSEKLRKKIRKLEEELVLLDRFKVYGED